MASPAFILICVAAISLALLLSLLIGNGSGSHRDSVAKRGHAHTRPVSFGSEREEFFIPGDPLNGQMDDNDD